MDLELELLARAVDERAQDLPECPEPARLFGVVADPRHEHIELQLLAAGEPRVIPTKVWPPAGLVAIALVTRGWMAPFPDDGDFVRPSKHPDRVRVGVTALVAGDGVDVTVVRRANARPLVMHGDVGYVNRLMVRCWSRRADGPRMAVIASRTKRY